METIKDNFFSRKGYSNVVLTIILMVTLLTGLVSITLRSPMVGLDEMGHYARSIELSNGNLLSLQDGNPALAGGKISNTQYEFIEKAKQVQSGNSTKYKATDKDWYHKFSSIPFTNQKRFYVAYGAIPFCSSPSEDLCCIQRFRKIPLTAPASSGYQAAVLPATGGVRNDCRLLPVVSSY